MVQLKLVRGIESRRSQPRISVRSPRPRQHKSTLRASATPREINSRHHSILPHTCQRPHNKAHGRRPWVRSHAPPTPPSRSLTPPSDQPSAAETESQTAKTTTHPKAESTPPRPAQPPGSDHAHQPANHPSSVNSHQASHDRRDHSSFKNRWSTWAARVKTQRARGSQFSKHYLDRRPNVGRNTKQPRIPPAQATATQATQTAGAARHYSSRGWTALVARSKR